MFSFGHLHMDTPVLTDQQKFSFISSVNTGGQLETCQEQWLKGTYGGGACGVMVIVVGNGYGDTSSNPGRG